MDTPESQSVLVTGLAKGPWRRFYVHLAGDTNGTHREFVLCLRRLRQFEVSSLEESDYVVVFCPFMSQDESDFSEALEDIPVGKPTILVVMHHTVDRNHVVAESRRLVNNPNVHLTVDVLLRKGKITNCKQNRTVWHEVRAFLTESYRGYSKKIVTSRDSVSSKFPGLMDHQIVIFVVVTMTVLLLMGVISATILSLL